MPFKPYDRTNKQMSELLGIGSNINGKFTPDADVYNALASPENTLQPMPLSGIGKDTGVPEEAPTDDPAVKRLLIPNANSVDLGEMMTTKGPSLPGGEFLSNAENEHELFQNKVNEEMENIPDRRAVSSLTNLNAGISAMPKATDYTLEQPDVPTNPYQSDDLKSLLERYKTMKGSYNPEEYKKLQDAESDRLQKLSYVQAANTLSRAIGVGRGGHDFGDLNMQSYEALAKKPAKDYLDRVALEENEQKKEKDMIKEMLNAGKESFNFDQTIYKNKAEFEKDKKQLLQQLTNDKSNIAYKNSLIKSANLKLEDDKMDFQDKFDARDPKSVRSSMAQLEALRNYEKTAAAEGKEQDPKMLALIKKSSAAELEQLIKTGALGQSLGKEGFQRAKLAQEQAQEDRRVMQSERGFMNNIVKETKAEEPYKYALKVLTKVNTIENLLKDAVKNGGNSRAMLGPQLAKGIAGEVGALTEEDVTRYVEDPSIAGRLRDTIAKLKSSKISEETGENILRMLDIVKQDAGLIMKKRHELGAERYLKSRELFPISNTPVTKEDYLNVATGEIQHDLQNPSLTSNSTSDTVKFRRKKDGKVALVPKDKAANYLNNPKYEQVD